MRSRAVLIRRPGGPEVLELDTIEVGVPGPHEIRVRVAAAGLNRADLMQRQGLYPAPPGVEPNVPGLELSGEVEAIGERVSRWTIGERVMAIVGGAAMAEHALLHEDQALAVPASLTLEQAAAVPEAFITAHDALFTLGGLAGGERVLIHAVASGVGTAALQLAARAGAIVIGTSRSAAKLERAKALGLAHPILAAKGRFLEALERETGSGSVALILDLVGAAYFEESLAALAPHGRWILVGLLGGNSVELPLHALLSRRLRLIGTVLRPRSRDEKIEATRAFAAFAAADLAAGRIQPVIDAVLPMTEIVEAHRRMENNDSFGKLVLSWMC